MDDGEMRSWFTSIMAGVSEAKGAAMSARSEIRNHDTKVAGVAERLEEQQERFLEAITMLTNTINGAVSSMKEANRGRSIMGIVDMTLKVVLLSLAIVALAVFGKHAADLKSILP